MANGHVAGLPGVKTTRTATPRRILLSAQGKLVLPQGKIIDSGSSRDTGHTGDLDVLRAGNMMGKRSADNKYENSVLGVLASDYDKQGSGDLKLTMTVSAAVAVEIVRRLGSDGTFTITGPPSAAGTVATETVTYSAVDTATGAITVTEAGADYIAGSFIGPVSAAQTPLCLIPDEYGIKVTDRDGTDLDVPFATPLIGGVVDSSQIVFWPTDTSLIAWVISKLNVAGGGQFVFDHLF